MGDRLRAKQQQFVAVLDQLAAAFRQRDFAQRFAAVPVVMRQLARVADPDVLAGHAQRKFGLQHLLGRIFNIVLAPMRLETAALVHPRILLVRRLDRVGDLLLSDQLQRPDRFLGFQIAPRERAAMQINQLILADELRAAVVTAVVVFKPHRKILVRHGAEPRIPSPSTEKQNDDRANRAGNQSGLAPEFRLDQILAPGINRHVEILRLGLALA